MRRTSLVLGGEHRQPRCHTVSRTLVSHSRLKAAAKSCRTSTRTGSQTQVADKALVSTTEQRASCSPLYESLMIGLSLRHLSGASRRA
jgi:hypothetical protein